MDDVGASPSGVTFQVGSGLVGGVELGGDPATNEERIALLIKELNRAQSAAADRDGAGVQAEGADAEAAFQLRCGNEEFGGLETL